MGKQWKQWQTLFSWAPKSLQMVTAAMKLKEVCSLEKSYDQPRQLVKKTDVTLPTKVHLVKAMDQLWMWEVDHKESWAPKNWSFWTVELEKILESPLDCKEIKPVNPTEISPEYSLEELMLTLKLQYFGHLMWRTDSLEKTLMLGKIKGRLWEGADRGWDG